MAAPPFESGCIQETLIELPCDWLWIATGAEGRSRGEVGKEEASGLDPALLFAVTEKV
jgi:hypothetical protein